jgi:hypothetical protein
MLNPKEKQKLEQRLLEDLTDEKDNSKYQNKKILEKSLKTKLANLGFSKPEKGYFGYLLNKMHKRFINAYSKSTPINNKKQDKKYPDYILSITKGINILERGLFYLILNETTKEEFNDPCFDGFRLSEKINFVSNNKLDNMEYGRYKEIRDNLYKRLSKRYNGK